MCGRYTITDMKTQKLAQSLRRDLSNKESVEDKLGRYNVAPTQNVRAVCGSIGPRRRSPCRIDRTEEAYDLLAWLRRRRSGEQGMI